MDVNYFTAANVFTIATLYGFKRLCHVNVALVVETKPMFRARLHVQYNVAFACFMQLGFD